MTAYFIKNKKQNLISDNMASRNTDFNKIYPPEPTHEAQIDSDEYDSILLGENELGTVHLHGPFGKSDIKIAYLIGMHPMESKAHRGLFETILNAKDLNYEYYIYNINVFNIDNDTEGRMDGQLLAREFAADHIINEKYDLFLDIHSNKGLNGPGTYEKTNFVFAPNFDDESSLFMNEILEDIPELAYYAPEYRTSPPYITLPVAQSGIPTIVYETYSYEDMDVTSELSRKLVECVDHLEFK
jgi:hypothetical protein